MEINFIEEAAKALDTLSVERLVHTSDLGAVRCGPCGKRLYTYTQARFVVLRIRNNESGYTQQYSCPVQDGELYHITNTDKQLDKAKVRYPREVRQLESYKSYLDGLTSRSFTAGAARNLVAVAGRTSSGSYPKALRLQIIRALVFPLQGLRKPGRRLRRRYKPRKCAPRRDNARVDLPRGETVTKMLSWANGKRVGFNRRLIGYLKIQDLKRGRGEVMRRRNRSREAEAVRREIMLELQDEHGKDGTV